MKKIFVITTMFLVANWGFSQFENSLQRMMPSIKPVTLKDRYRVDYRLENETLLGADSTVLTTINSEFIDNNRKEQEDVVLHCPDSNIRIIIYSEEKVALNKAK
ncbi:MAG: hypothetical protein M9916_09945 [Crocinitomicaceae bacterium]|nr:hypothetical protein [Crocinitomicaceae bacterium]